MAKSTQKPTPKAAKAATPRLAAPKLVVSPKAFAATQAALANSASKLADREQRRIAQMADAKYWTEGLAAENAAPYLARLAAITHPAEAFDLKIRVMLRTLELILATINVAEAQAKRAYKIEAFTERFVTPREGKSIGWLQYIKSQASEQLRLARDEGKVDWLTFPTKGESLIKLFPSQVAQLKRAIENGEGIVHALENPRNGEKLMTPTWGVRSPGKTEKNRREGTLNRAAKNRAARAGDAPCKGKGGKKKQ